jgi:hypothetical protein
MAESDRQQAMERYLGVMKTILQNPDAMANAVAQGVTVDFSSMLTELYDAFGMPQPLASVHLDRYEEMNEDDKQMLRDMGIKP